MVSRFTDASHSVSATFIAFVCLFMFPQAHLIMCYRLPVLIFSNFTGSKSSKRPHQNPNLSLLDSDHGNQLPASGTVIGDYPRGRGCSNLNAAEVFTGPVWLTDLYALCVGKLAARWLYMECEGVCESTSSPNTCKMKVHWEVSKRSWSQSQTHTIFWSAMIHTHTHTHL